MNLTKSEKNILALDRFIENFHKEFPSASNIIIPFVEEQPKNYNSKNNIFPLVVRVSHSNCLSTYDWINSSDDEFPIYHQKP